MNRETYIRKVKKQLDCSVKEKEEIVRDLQEIFDSGKEHGKSESQIIKQLGKPRGSDAEKCHWRWGCDDDDRAAKLVTGKQQRDFWGIGGHLYGCTGFPFTKEEKIRRGILRNNGTHKEKTSGNCCVFRCLSENQASQN